LICGGFKVKRKEFVIIGICEILALIIVFLVIEKGYFTRFDAFLMIITLIFYSIIIYSITKSDMLEKVNLMIENKDARQKKKRYHGFIAIISFIGVAICSYFLINAIIEISSYFNIQEYILSFLIVSIGTSMPELAVDISALRRKKYNIAIGDIMGSCIVDSTLSIGIGQLLFPQKIVSNIAIQTILVVMVIAIIVTIIISVRQKVDKKMGVLLIAIYFIAFFFILSL
ncbi:MAG: sodium:calcium antiporter, partial [Promethearchaeota archaeon]